MRPINGHVDFGFIECLVRVFYWVQPSLVDLLICGFQPCGNVPVVGCHRPIDEPNTEIPSIENFLKCFDDSHDLTTLTVKAVMHPRAYLNSGITEARDEVMKATPLEQHKASYKLSSTEHGLTLSSPEHL